jgi:hypothetical protein
MRKFLFAAILMLAFSGVMLADGSDPMPLCRPTANHQCPQVAPTPAPAPFVLNDIIAFDGGPGPICPPKQQCPWSAEKVAQYLDELRPTYWIMADGGPMPLCDPCPYPNCVPRRCPPMKDPDPKKEIV